jgi:tetratricopeptide (TPR) repeat protein
MSKRSLPKIILLSLSSALAANLTFAGGLYFPNVLLEQFDAGLVAPLADFESELKAIDVPASPFAPRLPKESHFAQSWEAEEADLREALAEMGVPRNRQTEIVAAHREEREALNDLFRRRIRAPGMPPVSLALEEVRVVAGLPPEMADYFRGLILQRSGAPEEAREVWTHLLARPEFERTRRTLWATYMMGRSYGDDPAAIAYYKRVRELAATGHRDRIGLAAASVGWEARIHWKQGDYATALRMYLQQWQAGDETALRSLRTVAGDALKTEDLALLTELVREVDSQRIMTAFVISAHPNFFTHSDDGLKWNRPKNWLQAAEVAGIADMAMAERFALAAYTSAAFELSERWLALASPDAPVVRWLTAKLLLRAGKFEEAGILLAGLTRQFPMNDSDEVAPAMSNGAGFSNLSIRMHSERADPLPMAVLTDLGVAHFARQDYLLALDAILRTDHWSDAAYVAERVVSLDELLDYVETRWPESPQDRRGDYGEEEWYYRFDPESDIRHLLARRLARAGRFSEARPFYPEKWRAHLDDYSSGLQAGMDLSNPPEVRADALWKAARIARHQGMELLGTELEPDWHVFRGGLTGSLTPEGRAVEGPMAISEEELRRAADSAAIPGHRFHYRYIAADLAWQAAEWMPNGSEETARVLCIAGSWLKLRDPQAADRFYKALVRRCGNTPMGREADRLRWFPPIEEE